MPSSEPGRRRRSTVKTGRLYEERAIAYYEQQGYEVVARNYRAGPHEIDLIVAKPELLIFVEVKGARSDKFGHPAERVDSRKIARLNAAARKYLHDHALESCDIRFDVIAFVGDNLEHYPNAFQAPE